MVVIYLRMSPEEAGCRAGRPLWLLLCLSHVLQQQMWEEENVNVRKGKRWWLGRCQRPVPPCASARQQEGSVSTSAEQAALPGRATPARSMKEKFCQLCRKIDDSENERFSMGCTWTEQISLTAPTLYYFSAVLPRNLNLVVLQAGNPQEKIAFVSEIFQQTKKKNEDSRREKASHK